MQNTNKSESGNIDFNPTFKSRRVSDFFTLAENDARLNLNGYKDPITMIVRDMETQMRKQEEAYLMETVREYGFDIDCEELKRALAYDRGQYIQGYRDAVEQYTRPKAEWLITNAYPHNVYCSNCHIPVQTIDIQMHIQSSRRRMPHQPLDAPRPEVACVLRALAVTAVPMLPGVAEHGTENQLVERLRTVLAPEGIVQLCITIFFLEHQP